MSAAHSGRGAHLLGAVRRRFGAAVAPASQVPVIVVLPASDASMTSSPATTSNPGAAGATVSTVIARVAAALVLPALSVCVALSVSPPCPIAATSAAVNA